MLRITDLPGPTLRFEGVLSGPEVDLATAHTEELLGRYDRIVIDLEFVAYADRSAIDWLRGLPGTRVTIIRAPMMIDELLREEGAA